MLVCISPGKVHTTLMDSEVFQLRRSVSVSKLTGHSKRSCPEGAQLRIILALYSKLIIQDKVLGGSRFKTLSLFLDKVMHVFGVLCLLFLNTSLILSPHLPFCSLRPTGPFSHSRLLFLTHWVLFVCLV